MEIGEDILFSARREVKEETGLDVELTYTTGIYNFISSTQDQMIDGVNYLYYLREFNNLIVDTFRA